jgi:hypothetical protein
VSHSQVVGQCIFQQQIIIEKAVDMVAVSQVSFHLGIQAHAVFPRPDDDYPFVVFAVPAVEFDRFPGNNPPEGKNNKQRKVIVHNEKDGERAGFQFQEKEAENKNNRMQGNQRQGPLNNPVDKQYGFVDMDRDEINGKEITEME